MKSTSTTRIYAFLVLVLMHAFFAFLSWGLLFGMGHGDPADRERLLGVTAQAVMTITHLPLLLPLESTYVGRQVITAAWPVAYLLNSVLAVGGVAVLWRSWRRWHAARTSA